MITLFELMVLAFMTWATLLDRLACDWPATPSAQEDSVQATHEQSCRQVLNHSHILAWPEHAL